MIYINQIKHVHVEAQVHCKPPISFNNTYLFLVNWETTNLVLVNHALISSWNKPVLGKVVSCSKKQLG